MNYVENLKRKVLSGEDITYEQAEKLYLCQIEPLSESANEIREVFCGKDFDICTIVNGKSGRCSEDCKYCAQSSHFTTNVFEFPLLDTKTLFDGAVYNYSKGIMHYSVVTSGRNLTDSEVEKLCDSFKYMADNCGISLCSSNGLLNYEQFCKLKSVGVARYHNNLETSRDFFKSICTTHTYDDKIAAIENAKRAGLEICSGGIIGLGETEADRINLAFELKKLKVKSIPINILSPIAGTPLAGSKILDYDEIIRAIAVFRFINPKVMLRLAGGRGSLFDKGRRAFLSGANAAISGDMLTTSGIGIDYDMSLIKELGFRVKNNG